jgi:hypothetical protein
MKRVNRHTVLKIRTAVAVLVLLGCLFVAPAARAATTGTIAVTAEVVSTFSLTLNDQTADFGTNLTSTTTTSNSTDVIYAKLGGSAAFFLWRPTTTTGVLAHVVSSTPWNATLAATESTGTSSLRLQNQDLRLVSASLSQAQSLYCAFPNSSQNATFNEINSQPAILPGSTSLANGSPTSGADIYGCLALRVANDDTAGTFNSTLTITVTG